MKKYTKQYVLDIVQLCTDKNCNRFSCNYIDCPIHNWCFNNHVTQSQIVEHCKSLLKEIPEEILFEKLL